MHQVSWWEFVSLVDVRFNSFRHSLANIESNSALSNSPKPRRAKSTTSKVGSLAGSVRKNSRATRFTRLRWTANRTFFLAITKPKRWITPPLVFARSNKFLCDERESGLSNTLLYSLACRRRFSLPKPLSVARVVNTWLYALRRLRPFARRRFNTCLPPLVAIRARKPCVRARLSTLG